MKEKVKKRFEKIKAWWDKNRDKIFCYALIGGSLFAISEVVQLFYESGYEIGREEKNKSDLKSLLGEYEAHDAGYIKYFDPFTGAEVSRKEALELFKKS